MIGLVGWFVGHYFHDRKRHPINWDRAGAEALLYVVKNYDERISKLEDSA